MTEKSEHEAATDQSAGRRRRLRGCLVGAALVVLALALPVGVYAAATQMENRDAFCTSCHTEPEETYYQQTQDGELVNLADLHHSEAVRCIDCHSGAGPTGRVGSLLRGARDFVAYASGNYADPAVTTKPIADASCNKCHADVLRYSGEPEEHEDDSGLDGHYHAWVDDWRDYTGDELARCVACHPGHTVVAEDDRVGYMSVSQAKEVCRACHRALED